MKLFLDFRVSLIETYFMRLGDYLTKNEIKPLDFAKSIGLRGKASIYRYLKGECVPNPTNMNKISEATNGQVTPNDFYSVEGECH